MSDEVFFKKVESPVELRKNLLESSRKAVKSLQKYKDVNSIRLKKSENILKLKILMKEINQLLTLLKKKMPDIASKAVKAKMPSVKEPKKIKEEVKKVQPELADLENQLNDIEKKLGSL